MSESIGVIVLAAGQGSRFRQLAGADKDKLLADCTGRDGAVRSVIEHVLANLPANGGKRVLVTTADRPQVIRMAQAYGCEIVLIESIGMGDSIAAGVSACAQLDGWLMVLGTCRSSSRPALKKSWRVSVTTASACRCKTESMGIRSGSDVISRRD